MHISHIGGDTMEKGTLTTYDENNDIKDMEDVEIYARVQKRHFRKGEFFMASFLLDKLCIEKSYDLTTLRTLMVLKSMLDYNNRIKTFKQTDIAEKIGTQQAHVSRALKRLRDDRIIIKKDNDYYFNEVFIKGAGDNTPKNNIITL